MFIELSPYLAGAVPVVTALVSVGKLYVDSYYAPLLSLFLGIGVSALLTGAIFTPEMLWQGIMLGLMASGLYSGGKTLLQP